MSKIHSSSVFDMHGPHLLTKLKVLRSWVEVNYLGFNYNIIDKEFQVIYLQSSILSNCKLAYGVEVIK